MSSSKQIKAMLPKPGPAMIVDTFRLVLQSTNEYISVIEQERTKRIEIQASLTQQLEVIHVQRDFLLSGLEKTFDERRENFQRLFDQLDVALVSSSDDSGSQIAEILGAITDLAKISPFKDLKSPALVVQEFLQSGRAIEI
jgi:CHASE3 domain sensor protein